MEHHVKIQRKHTNSFEVVHLMCRIIKQMPKKQFYFKDNNERFNNFAICHSKITIAFVRKTNQWQTQLHNLVTMYAKSILVSIYLF